jgi:hypothetical protein
LRAVALLVVLLCSCEKDINFDLKASEPVLVVDAQIENGQPPDSCTHKKPFLLQPDKCKLFLQMLLYIMQMSTFPTALTKHKLKEFPVTLAPGGFTAYVYSNDPASPCHSFFR